MRALLLPARPAVAIALLIATLTLGAAGPSGAAAQDDYGALLRLFEDWREFAAPQRVDGVPDYTAAAMASQQRDLRAYQQRLDAMGVAGWPLEQQIDWRLVKAEMNGLDFDHRIRRPWANNLGVLRDDVPGGV